MTCDPHRMFCLVQPTGRGLACQRGCSSQAISVRALRPKHRLHWMELGFGGATWARATNWLRTGEQIHIHSTGFVPLSNLYIYTRICICIYIYINNIHIHIATKGDRVRNHQKMPYKLNSSSFQGGIDDRTAPLTFFFFLQMKKSEHSCVTEI